MSDVPAVEMSGVNFAYDGSPVLLDVNISVPERDLAGIVGPNGG
ncbi:MAG: zinc ABC transporter ATP-binding protein, partial [Armatimonadia bacterium]|nr:zinc ABC transporter ATP-binding protein [Armatimonadia bacterium]